MFYGALSTGASITVIEFGGIVRNGPETLEVAQDGGNSRKDYLLFLAKVPDQSSTAYFNFNFSHPQLVGNRIYAGKERATVLLTRLTASVNLLNNSKVISKGRFRLASANRA